MIHNEGTTVLKKRKAFAHITDLQAEINRMNNELSEREDYESESYQSLIDKLAHANERLQIIGGGNFHAELKRH